VTTWTSLRENSCPGDPRFAPTAPPSAAIERLVGVLMDLWNDTRVTPPTAAPRRRTKVDATRPCPCGSGKKYKRCCMLSETTH